MHVEHNLAKIIRATGLSPKDVAQKANIPIYMVCDILQNDRRPNPADRAKLERALLPATQRSTQVRVADITTESQEMNEEQILDIETKPLRECIEEMRQSNSQVSIARASGISVSYFHHVSQGHYKPRPSTEKRLRECYAYFLEHGSLPGSETKTSKNTTPRTRATSKPVQTLPQPKPTKAASSLQSAQNIIEAVVQQIVGIVQLGKSFGLEVSEDSIARIRDQSLYELTRKIAA